MTDPPLPPHEPQRPSSVPTLIVPQGVTPFFLAHTPVRGRLVRLGPLADVMLTRHNLPDQARHLAGEALALVAGLSAALKFKGSISLQIKGDGPINTLVADSTHDGALRFYVSSPTVPSTDSAKDLFGEGYFALTLDQEGQAEKHQGIVGLEGKSLSEMAMHYFTTSEQLPCWIKLFCKQTPFGWQAGALILEKIAETSPNFTAPSNEDDAWETACLFAHTLNAEELFDKTLPSAKIIDRLFSTQNVIVNDPREVSLGCRCHRARLARILSTFPESDLNEMAEDGQVTMTCEFCNVDFRFSRDELF